jgi:hypothetical protein
LDRAIRYGAPVTEHLRTADASRKARAAWRAAAIADGLLVPFVVVVFATFMAVFGASVPLTAVALLVMAPIVAFFAFALSRAAASGNKIAPALDAAWLAAASDVARQTRGLTATSLAAKLGIGEPQAEELMALIDVNASLAPTRLRIEDHDAQAAEEEAVVGERERAEAPSALVARIDPPTSKP